MSSTVHYKLKSSSSAAGGSASSSGGWSTLHFDGVYLSILEFKRKVIYKEQWCKSEADANFDLLISNSNSGEEYRDDTYSVHRNVSVLVKRVPAASPAAARKLYIPPGSLPEDWNKSTSTWVPPNMREANTNHTPLGAGGAGEEGDIAAMMQQRGSLAGARRGHAPSGPFQPSFNTRTLTPTSKPPGGYVCHRCKQGGHYIQFCPTNGDHKYDMAQRSNTTREDREREREREKEKVQSHVAWGERDYSEGGGGRPRHGAPAPTPSESAARWLKPVVDPKGLQAELNGGVAPVVEETPAQLKQRMFPSQFFAASAGSTVPVTNPTLAPHDPHAERLAAYARAVAESAPSAAAAAPAPAAPLRPDLTCSLCGDYFTSAAVLGCCYTSFCLECIQQHLQKTGACPSCASTDVTVSDLQPNANLQKAVDAFLLEHPSIVRGAIKQQKAMAAAAAASPAKPVQAPAAAAAPAPAPSSSYPSNGSDRRSDDRDSRDCRSRRSRSRSRDRDAYDSRRNPSAASASAPLLPASAAYPGAVPPAGAPWMQQPQPGMPMGGPAGAYGMMGGYPGPYGMPMPMQMQMPYGAAGMQPGMQQMPMQMGGAYGMHPMQMQMQQQYAAAGGANGYPMQMQQQQPHQGRHRSRSRSRERDQHRGR